MSLPSYYQKSIANKKKAFEHLNQKTPTHIEWEVVIIFYAALHLVNDYFYKNGIEFVKRHGGRMKAIKKDSKICDLYEDYRIMFERSNDARYEENVQITEEDRDDMKRRLSKIESKLSVV